MITIKKVSKHGRGETPILGCAGLTCVQLSVGFSEDGLRETRWGKVCFREAP